MMKINLQWRGPIYNDTLISGQKRIKEEHCRTMLLLNITVKGLGKELAKDILETLVERFNQETNMVEDEKELLLSTKEWGVASVYDESTRSYVDAICIYKDFDNLANQKKALMNLLRSLAKELKYEFLQYYTEPLDDPFGYGVDI